MEPGTFTQLYTQLDFSPRIQSPMQSIKSQERVFGFVSEILKTLGHFPLAVNGMYDHIHIFYSMKPSLSISETVKEVKRVSSNFIKDEGLVRNFHWQKGYGAFSYSRSQIDRVIKYIIGQREHHKKETFGEEYIKFLEKFEIEYDPKYLFDFHS
jgi:hypothetical protein